MALSFIISLAVSSILVIGLAAYLGRRGQKHQGMSLLGFLAAFGSSLCAAGIVLGYSLAGTIGAWSGLMAGMIPSAFLINFALSHYTRIKGSGRPAALAWAGYWLLFMFSYIAGGWIGLFTIGLPAIALFWVELRRMSSEILPLRDKQDKAEQGNALRALITYTMGTNYPFYFIGEDSRPVKQVDGNSAKKYFAGPGFIITDADHAVYITDGVNVKGVFEPGLTFTGLYDLEPRPLDLRPQLRAFPVHALTKDGIPIKVVTSVPYRIDPGNQVVEPGHSRPFRKKSAYQSLAAEVVERKANKSDSHNGQKFTWDGGPADGLIPLLGAPVVRDIISRYTIDELCAPLDRNSDPRVEIAAEMRHRMKEILQAKGLVLIGGGISNLVPQDDSVIQKRIDNWRTKWVAKLLAQMSEIQSHRMSQLELARAKAEVEIIKRFGQNVRIGRNEGLHRTLALGFIDAMGDVVRGDEHWLVPNAEIEETLKRLRGEIDNRKKVAAH